MKLTKKSKTITFRVSAKLRQKLLKYSHKNQIPVSIIIRKWISEKLKRFN